jgi:hypothetical protein
MLRSHAVCLLLCVLQAWPQHGAVCVNQHGAAAVQDGQAGLV